MHIDCDTCAVRGPACGDCVVTVLLGAPPVSGPATREHHRGGAPGAGDPLDTLDPLDLDQAEQAAIAVLAGSGLVPPLRLVPVEPAPDAGSAGGAAREGRGPEPGSGAGHGTRCENGRAGGPRRRAAEAG